MAKLYREHVLGEKPVEGLVSLDSIAPAKPAQRKEAARSWRLIPLSLGSVADKGRCPMRAALCARAVPLFVWPRRSASTLA